MENDQIDDLNSGFVQELLADYLASPESVDPEWRELFESNPELVLERLPNGRRLRELARDGAGNGAPAAPPAPASPPAEAPTDDLLLGGVAAAMSLVKAHRTHGHLAAHIDPLGSEPPGDPALDPDRLEPRLTPELQALIPAKFLRLYVRAETLAEALPKLRETYCGTLAYEIEHISSHEQRLWLRDAIESGTYRQPLDGEERKALLRRLSEVEGFERYLRRAFLGQKQFSIEGLDVMVPMLDEAIELAAANGANHVVIGMAHRGRLSVLAHTVGRQADAILREFEGERVLEAVSTDLESGSGDVKYHLGAEATRQTESGEVTVTLTSNPSHLEYVDPVVEGEVRASQTNHDSAEGAHDPNLALAILIHGDAAFPGQGVVAETLNLGGLAGYTTGGTLHVIANNQVGFTTDPDEGRSTRYSSDLAKGFDTPIIHVNADDPEAAISAIRLAMAFRERFHHDVVVDLVGYRRFGHNEGDEPSYTQPLMYKLIEEHPTVREQYVSELVELGLVSDEEAEQLLDEVQASLRAVHEELRRPSTKGRGARSAGSGAAPTRRSTRLSPATASRAERAPARGPAGGLHRPSEARRGARAPARRARRRGRIDWAQAEALAFGSLLADGTPIRLTGRTRSAAPSRTAISSSTTTRRARSTRPSSTCPSRERPSRCTTRRSPRPRRSASSTATRSRFPARSSSGRRSSATSSTRRR